MEKLSEGSLNTQRRKSLLAQALQIPSFGVLLFLGAGLLFSSCGFNEKPDQATDPDRALILEPDKDTRLADEEKTDSLVGLAPSALPAPAPPPPKISGEIPDQWATYLTRAADIDAMEPDQEPAIDANYYYKGDSLVKISTHWKGQIEGHQTTYYFTNGELFLIRERYAGPGENGEVRESEDINFLKNGRLLRRFEAGDCGAPFARDYLDEVEKDLIRVYQALRE